MFSHFSFHILISHDSPILFSKRWWAVNDQIYIFVASSPQKCYFCGKDFCLIRVRLSRLGQTRRRRADWVHFGRRYRADPHRSSQPNLTHTFEASVLLIYIVNCYNTDTICNRIVIFYVRQQILMLKKLSIKKSFVKKNVLEKRRHLCSSGIFESEKSF